MNQNYRGQSSGGGLNAGLLRLAAPIIIGLILAGTSYFKYCASKTYNEYIGAYQHVSITPEEEIAIGLQSKPSMIQEYGGLDPDMRAQALVQEVGRNLYVNSVASKTPYQYEFNLLADPNNVNAFALPGGQIFITRALFNKLQSKDQLAGVLGHEIGHVIGRHAGERMQKDGLLQGLAGAVGVAAGDYQTAAAAQQIAALIGLKYGRDQELQSDNLGVRFMLESGYQPEELIGVMEILKEASGGGNRDEFSSSHPSPENRVEKIKEAIEFYRSGGKPQ
ncbi:MAG: M48 family metallopeptidase [Saprospiraceae bacterium]|nr:M48 family metallopeptidase [Saprospiraceae bacterium]